MTNGHNRPFVLSIAGFDPSAGAGLLGDIKTLEANKVYGMGVCTGITFQNDKEFDGVKWLSFEEIKAQLDSLFRGFEFGFIKIGLIENLSVLDQLSQYLQERLPSAKIIWDPILKASAGYDFHGKPDADLLKRICERFYLVTPNIPEALELGETEAAELNMTALSKHCNIFLKGGHHATRAGEDLLFLKSGKRVSFGGRTYKVKPKHGSGCILSSAIAARLARGAELEKACLLAKEYTLSVLESNESLLGYHYETELN